MDDRKRLYVFFAISLSLLGLIILLMFWPVMSTILLGIVFTYLFSPVHRFINRFLKRPWLSSMLVCLIFVFLITIPLILAANMFVRDVFTIANTFSDAEFFDTIKSLECEEEQRWCQTFVNTINNRVLQATFDDFLLEADRAIKRNAGTILLQIPMFVLSAFIILFMMFYLLVDGPKVWRRIYELLPLSEIHKKDLYMRINKVLGGIMFGSILVGAVQGLVGGIGFFLFGINAPLLFGILIFFMSFVPVVGTGIVWGPVAIFIAFEGVLIGDTTGIFRGVGLFLYGLLVIGTVDNLVRPKILSFYTDIHPVVVLVSVVGGVALFNIAGIFIGPLIAGIFLSILAMYEKHVHEKT